MTPLRLSAVALGAFLLAGCATNNANRSGPSSESFTNSITVVGGQTTRVDLFSSLTNKCTEVRDISARVTRQPTNGTVRIVRTRDFSFYPPNNPSSACNDRRVPVWVVYYTPRRGFAGPDSFTYVKAFGNDRIVTVTSNVTVQ